MKRSITLIGKQILTYCLAIFVFTSCNKDELNINPGNVVLDARNVENFNEIEIAHGFDVTMSVGDEESLVIEAPEGYQAYIHSNVINNRIVIKIDDDINPSRVRTRKIHLSVKSVNSILLSGGTTLICDDTIQEDDFELGVSGGSGVNLSVNAREAHINASGASEVSMAGTTEFLHLQQMSGGSKFFGFNFLAEEVDIFASGGSQMYVNVAEKLVVSASGGSIVQYKGNPVVESSLSGGSQVTNSN